MTTGLSTGSQSAQWEKSYRRRLLATDFVIIAVTVIVTQIAWFGLNLADVAMQHDLIALNYSTITVVLIVAWMACLQIYETRDVRVVATGNAEYRRVVDASVRLFGVVAIIAYLFQVLLARGYIITAFPAGIILLILGRAYWRSWIAKQRRKGEYTNKVLLVGSAESVLHTARELSRARESGYRLVGICTTSGSSAVEEEYGGIASRSGSDVDAIRGFMTEVGADTLIITSSDELPPIKVRQLSWTLEPGREHLVVAPSLTDIGGPRIHTRPVAGLPLIHVETPRFDAQQRFTKRAFDILSSSVLILLSAPVLLVIAILVKATSPGPVLFRQARIGIDGTTFEMLKFRSMVVDAEARLAELASQQTTEGNEILFKMKGDPRVTKVGAVLRRFSLDELPQFINVFRGDMSLIGPRPPLQREVEQYEEHVHRRFLMKPGITGLWQVSGRSNLSWEDTVRLDLYYVENWSMTGDLVILFKTARAVLARDGAY